ncbi:MAG: histidine phosphatase family protein [Lachnospiraceae bacterium]|jgi:broad specificity phosphatase PhoE|nr:histidine phosphatase family protein [Lachnospiraceae bacterium]MEE3461421.1 histidine phosphatase family protein [Lachnospiraceae bacterium]
MNIWLVRHGQTDYNLEHRIQGRSNMPLNATGIAQAERVRKKIEEIGVSFDAVYSSPLKRAVKTASIVGNIDPDNIKIDKRIIEVNFGDFEGRHWKDKDSMPLTRYWSAPMYFKRPEGVEPVKHMEKRADAFLSEIEALDHDNVLVVCHGGIIRVLRRYLEDNPEKIDLFHWNILRVKNCQVCEYKTLENGKHKRIRIIQA